MFTKKPILITGSHRSGSTWIGKVLASSPETIYVHEPFNIGIQRKNNPIENWHQAINDRTSKQKQVLILKYLRYFYGFPISYIKEEFSKVQSISTFRDFGWIMKQRLNRRTIIKDPIAIFSAEWIYQKTNCDVIVSIRHPAAFVASLKMKNWNTDFNELKRQKEFQQPVLKKYESQITEAAENQPDIISSGILLWNMIYDMVKYYKDTYGDVWLFYKHEDVSTNPQEIFQEIFKKINIPFSIEVEEFINLTTKNDEGSHLVRDSKKNIHTWKDRLTQEQIAKIKEETRAVWELFYAESDWN
jgi:hypothetical protein